MNRSSAWLSVVFLSLAAVSARAEPPARPSLHLQCRGEGCFESFLRQELSYFDLARDARLADYALIIVRQPAGNGGERFTVLVNRGDGSSEKGPPHSFVAEPGAAPHDARRQLLQTILRALQVELLGTPHASAFELGLPKREDAELSALQDPWNSFVIAPEIGGEAELFSGYYGIELMGSVTLRRITDTSKLRLRGLYSRTWNGYRLEDGSYVRGDIDSFVVRPIYGHSIGPRWTLGGVAAVSASEYENLEAHLHGGPLIECNLFPYEHNASEQLRLAYQVGAWANWYIEETRLGRMREVRPYNALSLIIDANQPWGSVQWVGQINMFLDDPSLYRASTGAIVSLRLALGFAISLEGEAALVRDQISLRDRPVTDTELLLWTVQQETDFEVDVGVSISYTFGSTRNAIVNPRFGRVDLVEDD